MFTKQSTNSMIKIFSLAGYQGEAVNLARGEYAGDTVKEIASVSVADFTRVIFYENAAGIGKRFVVDKDSAAVKIPFVPQLIAVESYAKGVLGQNIKQLAEGEYLTEEMKGFDKILLPRGFYAVFAGNKKDKKNVRIFENEECVIDKLVDEYKQVLLFTLGQEDVRIDFGIKEELSDEDLLAVAGGKCKEDCRIFSTGCPSFCAEHKGPLDGSFRTCGVHYVTK